MLVKYINYTSFNYFTHDYIYYVHKLINKSNYIEYFINIYKNEN